MTNNPGPTADPSAGLPAHDDPDVGDDAPGDVVELLRDLATCFEARDWDYTRVHDIKHIRMADDYRGYDRVDRRVLRTLRRLVRRDHVSRMLGIRLRDPRHMWAALRVGLGTDPHLPDGVLDGGNVVTFWEETGEYLQLVQPSVGALLADWLEAEPDNVHARTIRAELTRLHDRYRQRIAAGNVTGGAGD